MSDLHHLQAILLMMAKDIDKICIDNNIDYYLVAGSALGAVRHKGFIPWDDDFDITMDSCNYLKFLSVAKEKLDSSKYYIQEGYKDWPMPYTKVRLLGTFLQESDIWEVPKEKSGIFIDVFPMENAPSNRIKRFWQYMCGKIIISYCLKKRGIKNVAILKRFVLAISMILENKTVRSFFKNQVEKYRNLNCIYLGSFSGNQRFKTTFFRRLDYSEPIRVPFEDTMLPIPPGYDRILRQIYGDYMTPPPVEKQVETHLVNVDFGNY